MGQPVYVVTLSATIALSTRRNVRADAKYETIRCVRGVARARLDFGYREIHACALPAGHVCGPSANLFSTLVIYFFLLPPETLSTRCIRHGRITQMTRVVATSFGTVFPYLGVEGIGHMDCRRV